jgi:hypothetical protein
MKRLAVLAIALVIASTGCAAGRSKNEPGIIALRNSTGATLTGVRISEDRDANSGGGRLGELSPVLPDITYTFVRPTDAPPLPRRVRVRWRDASNLDRSAAASTEGPLKQATGAVNEALLFEILPGGRVEARIDRASGPGPR